MAKSTIIKNDINIYPAIFFPLLLCGAAMLLPSACAIIPAFLIGSCQLYCPEPKAITILSKHTAIVIIDYSFFMRPHHKQTVKQQYTQVSYPISPVAYKTAPLAPSIDTPYLTVVPAYALLGVICLHTSSTIRSSLSGICYLNWYDVFISSGSLLLA